MPESRCGATVIVFLLALILAPVGRAEAPSADANSREFIRTWLLCGPFPNPLPDGVEEYEHDETCLGYYTDYLEPVGGETGVKPAQGEKVTGPDGAQREWMLYSSPQDYIDLTKVYEQNQQVVAYAAYHVQSGSDRDIVIGLGSNDGIKAWLNGAVIWDNHLPRGADADQDWVLAPVKKGQNLLLLKIDQGLGDWGFYARVLDREEKQAELMAEPAPEIALEYKPGNDHLNVQMGRTSRYLILDPLPICTISLVDPEGIALQAVSAPLGARVSIWCGSVAAGPYMLEGVAQLPEGRTAVAKEYYHHGPTKLKLRVYDRDGTPTKRGLIPRRVQFLDRNFEAVRSAIEGEEPGIAGVLRPDISPFRLRLLVESPALGRRWYLADNDDKGFVPPTSGQRFLDLPLEAAKSLRAKVKKTLAESTDLPEWLRTNLEQRLGKTVFKTRDPEPPAVHAALDTLSSLKSRLPSGGSVAIWYAPGIEKVAKDEPVPEFDMNAVHVSLARNEYEPFQIVLRPATDVEHLSVEFSSAKSQGGILQASNFAAHVVQYVDVDRPSDHFGTVGPWPDPIPPIAEPFDVAKADENTPIWVTVYAPTDQAEGNYRGEIRILAQGNVVAQAPIEIELYDFALPDETGTETAYGVNVNRDYHGPLTDEQFREVHDLYMKLCASHRISPYAPHAGAGIDMRFEGDPPQPAIDFTKFDTAMSRYLDELRFTTFNMGGIPGELGGHPRYSEEYNRLFKEAYFQVQEHLWEKGWLDKAYWYWVDEPPKSRYDEVKQGMELLKASCPDIRRLLTCNAEDAPVPYFFGLVNLWVPIMDRYVAERAHERQNLGETVWWYVCTGPKAPYPNNFIDHPAINHRIRWWMIDKYGLDGSLYWSVTWYGQNPWEQAMSISPSGGPWGNGDGRLLYPPRQTKPTEPVIEPPVNSIRFENLRDGIEDREYLLLLREIAEGDGTKAKTARDVLSTVESALVQTLTCYEQNPALFLAARHRVARVIEFAGID
jgi:hypothetical protein